jgi:hypothetical protein
MSEQRLDQLYCTHCTYHTSALHRRDGASGDQVFEESTRAGSVPRDKSHEVYSRFASCLLFHVPGDMPSELMVQHNAHTLPLRRMVYLPSVGGYRLLTQVAFRSKDTRGRPGASFAHVLIQDLKETPIWAALDCLQLWGSKKWVVEDGPQLPYELSSFKTLQEFDPDEQTPIDDAVLLSFLTTPALEEFHDPGSVIPARWQKAAPEARRKLLEYLVQAVLNLDFSRQEKLLLVVEPSVAALLFYGIIRLLPAVGIAEKISFSTYESHRDRLLATLTATCFHDPAATDLPSDWYSAHARGAAMNTFKADRFTPPRKTGRYAGSIVAKFIHEGPHAVDSFLAICRELGVGKAEDLENLSSIDGLVEGLISSQSPEQLALLERELPREPGLRAFLRKKLVDSIDHDVLSVLLAHPAQLLLNFKLLTEAGSVQNASKLQTLIEVVQARWPADAACELLKDKDIAKEQKISLLSRLIAEKKPLPKDVVALLAARDPIFARDKLLEEVLLRLKGEALPQFVQKTFDDHPTEVCFCELLRGLALHWARTEYGRAFRDLFRHPRFRDNVTEKTKMLTAALADKFLRETVARTEDFEDETFSAYLIDILNSLQTTPQKLDQRLELLSELQNLIPLHSRKRVEAWKIISEQLRVLQQLNAEQPNFFKKLYDREHAAKKDQAAKELGFASLHALQSTSDYIDSRPGTIIRLVTTVLGSEAQLPDQFQAHVQNLFATDSWELQRVRKKAKASFISKKRAIIAAGVTCLLAILAFGAWQWQKSSRSEQTLAENKNNDKTPSTKTTRKSAASTKTTVSKGNIESKKENNGKPKAFKAVSLEELKPSVVMPQDDPGNSKVEVPTTEAAVAKAEGEVEKTNASSAGEPPPNKAIPAAPETTRPNGAVWRTFCDLPNPPSEFTTRPVYAQVCLIPNLAKNSKLKISGIEELNNYWAKASSSRYRLYCDHDFIEVSPSKDIMNIYVLPESEYRAQRNHSDPAGLKEVNPLCSIMIKNNALHFYWSDAKPFSHNDKWPEPEKLDSYRKSFQELLQLCCVQIVEPKETHDINLISPSKIFTRNGGKVQYTYERLNKKSEANFEFNSHIHGFVAFEWAITKGIVTRQDNSKVVANKFSLDKTTLTTASLHLIKAQDQEYARFLVESLAKIEVVCGAVQFVQRLSDDQTGKCELKLTLIPDFSETELKERLDIIANCKRILIPAVFDLWKSIELVKSNKDTGNGDLDKAKRVVLRPLLDKIEKLARQLDKCFQQQNAIEGDPPTRKSLEDFKFNLSDTATIEGSKESFDQLQLYANGVKTSFAAIETLKMESRANSLYKVVKNNGENDLDTLSKQLMLKIKTVEATELCRLLDGRWIPIFEEEKHEGKVDSQQVK